MRLWPTSSDIGWALLAYLFLQFIDAALTIRLISWGVGSEINPIYIVAGLPLFLVIKASAMLLVVFVVAWLSIAERRFAHVALYSMNLVMAIVIGINLQALVMVLSA